MTETLLSRITFTAHKDDTRTSILKEAERRALHEYKQQKSMAVWSKDYVLVCTQADEENGEYTFEVLGSYLYTPTPAVRNRNDLL